MGAWDSRREDWDDDVASARGRARLAMGALALTIAVRVFLAAVAAWQVSLLGGVATGQTTQATLEASDQLYSVGAMVQLVVLLATGVLFLRWLAKTTSVTRIMITQPLRWTASQAVWGFFIPFVNLTRPYHVMRDLHDRLDPDGVPEPAPRARPEKAGGYRDVPVERAPLPSAVPPVSIGLWWGLYIVGGLVDNFSGKMSGTTVEALTSARYVAMFADTVEIVGAILAVQVVRAIDARLAERHRKLHHASDEELEAWGLSL